MINEDGSIVHEVRFPHPIERVWNAIVDRAALAQWLMENDFEPRVGSHFHFDAGTPRGLIEVEVLALEPPRSIQWRWMLDGVATTVTIMLHADGGGTVLRLEHTGIPLGPRPDFDSGWVDKFRDLTTLLKGEA